MYRACVRSSYLPLPPPTVLPFLVRQNLLLIPMLPVLTVFVIATVLGINLARVSMGIYIN